MNFKKRANVFGKMIPIYAVIALISMAGIGSGALLNYYGQITAEVTVTQAIVLTGGGCSDNECSSTLNATGSETGYSALANIVSNTVNDLKIKFINTCDSTTENCDGVYWTNMVELGVKGAQGATDPFESQYYKASDYQASGLLSALDEVTYAFNITYNDFGVTNLVPYIVIVGEGVGPVGIAVQLIPDGGTYNEGAEYVKTVDDATLFHLPGPSNWCSQGTPCTLAEIKDMYSGATVNRIRVALGAWTGTPDIAEMKISMGISTIDGVQAIHKYLTVYGLSTVPTVQKYDFAENIEPGTYTITTQIQPVV